MQALFGFSGRINRLEFFAFWMLQGVVVLVGIVLSVVIGLPLLQAHNLMGVLPMLITAVVAMWIWLAITAKRLTDIGVPKGLRRYLYIGWFVVSGVIGAALGPHNLVLKLALGQGPYLFLLFWPSRRSDGPAFGGDLAPARPAPEAGWADRIDFTKPIDPFPTAPVARSRAAAPAPARPAAPFNPNAPRTTFGRRGA